MLNHKCCCYTYLLGAVVGFTLRLGHRGYITASPRPRPLSSKCLIYPPPLLPPLYIFNTTFLVCKRSLSYIYICVVAFLTAVYIHSFFFFFVVNSRLVRVRTARGIFNHEFLHFFIYMCCALKQWRGRETLTSNAIGGRYKKQNTVLLIVCII